MGKYKVWLYRDKDGDSPIEDFFDKINKIQVSKITRQILHLSEYGISVHNRALKKMTGTALWEVRILGKDNLRLLCANTHDGIAVLHVFTKKSQKTRSSDISIALKRLADLTKYI